MTDPTTRLVKPTLNTPFHIDCNWWERESRELRVYLQSHLCEEHRARFESITETGPIDWIDPDPAEVQQVDGLQHALRAHCSQPPASRGAHTSLVDAVFRVFLANGNAPLTAGQLAERIGKPNQAATILKTPAGAHVYKSPRPF